jgi:hypothetical protein
MLRKRIERAMAFARRRKDLDGDLPEEGEVPLEKGDMAAMIISALLVFLPIALVVLGVIVLIGTLWLW